MRVTSGMCRPVRCVPRRGLPLPFPTLPLWACEDRQHSVECVKLVEIPMTASGRAWATIRGAMKVVSALKRACRKHTGRDTLLNTWSRRRDVVKHPVDPCHSWCGRVGRVRVVDDQHEAFRIGRFPRPHERRRDVCALAGVAPRNLSPSWKACEARAKAMVRSSVSACSAG